MARKMKSQGMNGRSGRDDQMRNNIVRGLTGVALATGLLAVGAALANRKNREMIRKGAKTAFEKMSDLSRGIQSEGGFGRAVSHRISMRRKGKGRKSTKKGMMMREMMGMGRRSSFGRAVTHRISMARKRGTRRTMGRSTRRGRSKSM